MWDLLPARFAPVNDGLVGPFITAPVWLNELSSHAEAYEFARDARERAEQRVAVAIEKASRLVSLSLTLLTLSLALLAYQADLLDASSLSWWWATMIPTVAAVLSFSGAVVVALDADRPGLQLAAAVDRLVGPGVSFVATRLQWEERARQLASWTARNKFTTFLRARSWFSRGVVLLFVSAVVVLFLRSV